MSNALRNENLARSRAAGFSLFEVLISLIIISVGMLGLAKIQALAYSSTGTASMRSLAAIQASSMAASMHANNVYWTKVLGGFSYTFAGTAAPTSTDAGLIATPDCSAPCTPVQVAAYDLNDWRTSLGLVLPNVYGTISCPLPVSGPISCVIELRWSENITAVNAQSQGNAMPDSTVAPYRLNVVP